ncbi:MAG: hypothetical protein AAF610_04730 [Pseudomonadota bacterium]
MGPRIGRITPATPVKPPRRPVSEQDRPAPEESTTEGEEGKKQTRDTDGGSFFIDEKL